MDIFHEVKQVLVACETPREFLVAAMGESWQWATIAHYRVWAGSDLCCYSAVLAIQCPDCGEQTIAMAAFVACEQGGYTMLKPESVDMAL